MSTRCLLAGINDYNFGGVDQSLPSCINDAHRVEAYILKLDPKADIHTIIDSDVTPQRLDKELIWLTSNVSPNDRLIFFFSGHGYQEPVGNSLEERLVLYGAKFYSDDHLVAVTDNAPPGTLICILDSCFSGGMSKLVISPGEEPTKQKFWKMPEADTSKSPNFASGVKRFGLRATKPFISPIEGNFIHLASQPFMAKLLDEQGQPTFNGMLISACSEDETAAASSSATQGLSAFTYSFVTALDKLGGKAGCQDLLTDAKITLTTNNFRQTPVLYEPPQPTGMGSMPLITSTMPPTGVPGMTPGNSNLLDIIRLALESGASTPQPAKDFTKPFILSQDWHEFGTVLSDQIARTVTDTGKDPSLLTDVELSQILSRQIPVVIGSYLSTKKALNQSPADFPGQGKFWGRLGEAILATIPLLLQAATKDFSPNTDNKSWIDKLRNLVVDNLPTIAEYVANEVLGKGIEPHPTFSNDKAFWESFIQCTIDIASHIAFNNSKAFSIDSNDKSWLDSVKNTLLTYLPIVVSSVLVSSKAYGEPSSTLPHEKDKFWSELIGVIANVLPDILASATASKDFVSPADEKGWFSDILSEAVPVIIRTIPTALALI
jgi:hypothetical protein